VLDLDATDDPLYGEQEGRHFHGYYDCYCYLPLYIFCGRHLLAAKLRTSRVDSADGSVAIAGSLSRHRGGRSIRCCRQRAVGDGDNATARRRAMSSVSHRDAGFSVLELVIALTLVGLFLALLAPSIRFGQRAWELSEEIERRGATPAALQFLEQRLTDARLLLTPNDDGSTSGSFYGDRDALRFVAPQPPTTRLGGFYSYELKIVVEGAHRRLVLETALRTEEAKLGPSHETVIADRVGAFALRFYGRPSVEGAPRWSEAWHRFDVMPDLVDVRFRSETDGAEHWIIVPLRAR